MNKQKHERVPIWKQVPEKLSFWKRAVKPFLLVSIVFVAWLVLRVFPVSSGLKYIGSIVTLLVAVGAFIIKNYPEYKKSGRFSPASAEVVTTLGAVFLALITIGGTWTGDQEAQKKAVEDAATKSKQERISDNLQLREIAVAQGEKSLALQAEENKREELANAASHAADINLQERVTQSLTRAEASRNRQEQMRDAQRIRLTTLEQAERTRDAEKSIALHNDVKQTAQNVKSLRETLHGLERALNPIQSISVSYQVRIPLDDPQMSQYRKDLNEAVNTFLANGKRIEPNSPFVVYQTTTYSSSSHVDHTLSIRRGSTLYPSDPASVRTALFSYPIELRFWDKLFHYKNGYIGGNKLNLIIRTAADRLPPDVYYNLDRKWLYFVYKGTLLPNGSYTMNAPKGLSLLDLTGEKVQVSQDQLSNFLGTDGPSNNNDYILDDLKKKYYVSEIFMQMSNRLFVFGEGGNNWSYFNTAGGTQCTFTFHDNMSDVQLLAPKPKTVLERSPIP